MSFTNRVIGAVGVVLLVAIVIGSNVKPVRASKPLPPIAGTGTLTRPPLPVQPTYTQPVAINAAEEFAQGIAFANADAAYTVPAGKRLILQYVSAEVGLPSGQSIVRQIVSINDVSQPGVALRIAYLTTSANVPAAGVCACDQMAVINSPVTLYAEPGQRVNFGASRNGNTGTAFVFINAIGYLVNASNLSHDE